MHAVIGKETIQFTGGIDGLITALGDRKVSCKCGSEVKANSLPIMQDDAIIVVPDSLDDTKPYTFICRECLTGLVTVGD